ncbi:hypothetical protein NDU88_004509 [Pleurodeles waltl]|uniref:Uncharacterized protein n=1 Tax=Pleurodeles waltl TaxID=8319 RepID=A0AAV7MBX2_PLEWA|nr:hypothetical protein NDU88_004509 [Pleurodeles waltl]
MGYCSRKPENPDSAEIALTVERHQEREEHTGGVERDPMADEACCLQPEAWAYLIAKARGKPALTCEVTANQTGPGHRCPACQGSAH